MKKYYFATVALGAMMLASCSNEDIVIDGDGDGMVTFTAQLPSQMASRSYADGTTAKQLHYAVYTVENGVYTHQAALSQENGAEKTETFTDLTASISLKLVNGKTYAVAFWAAAQDAPYNFDKDTKTVTVTTTGDSQAEDRDAFFATTEPFTVTGAIQKNVTLTRPFAQINIGTNDIAEFQAAGGSIEKSGLKITAPNSFDIITGEVGTTTADYVFSDNDLPTEAAGAFPINGYDYLTMDYVLVGAEKTTVDVTCTTANAVPDVTFYAVPVQRNYRTNIFGSLLTNPADFTVNIDKEFEEADYKYLAGNVKLEADYTPGAVIKVAKGNTLTIDLNGHNITDGNFYVEGTLNIKGEGKITAKDGLANIAAVSAIGADAVVNISDATIIGGKDENGDCNSTIFANKGGIVNIYSGTFDATAAYNGKYYVLNVQNNSGSKINVYGGEFMKQNPTQDDADGTKFVADGYTCSQVAGITDTWEVYKSVTSNDKEALANLFSTGGVGHLTSSGGSSDIETEGGKIAAPVTLVIPEGTNVKNTGSYDIAEGGSLKIVGTAPKARNASTGLSVIKSDKHIFQLAEGTSLYVENVCMKTIDESNNSKTTYSFVFIDKSNVEVTLKNVEMMPDFYGYAMSTNATNILSGVKLNLENVSVRPTNASAGAVLLNVPVELNASNCYFEGCNNAIILRGGVYEFNNCEFFQTLGLSKYPYADDANCATSVSDIKNTFRPLRRTAWGTGNVVPLAAVVIGNNGKAYQYPTNAVFNDCKISVIERARESEDVASRLPAIYAFANQGEGLGVNITLNNTTVSGDQEYASPNITVNGADTFNYEADWNTINKK